MDAYTALAVSASVPFRDNLNGTTLRTILASGVAPGQWYPHLNRALTEAPIGMIARPCNEHTAGPKRGLAFARLRQVAAAVDASDQIEAWLGGSAERR